MNHAYDLVIKNGTAVTPIQLYITQKEHDIMWNDKEQIYQVTINHEKQYSAWPADRKERPLGWKAVGLVQEAL